MERFERALSLLCSICCDLVHILCAGAAHNSAREWGAKKRGGLGWLISSKSRQQKGISSANRLSTFHTLCRCSDRWEVKSMRRLQQKVPKCEIFTTEVREIRYPFEDTLHIRCLQGAIFHVLNAEWSRMDSFYKEGFMGEKLVPRSRCRFVACFLSEWTGDSFRKSIIYQRRESHSLHGQERIAERSQGKVEIGTRKSHENTQRYSKYAKYHMWSIISEKKYYKINGKLGDSSTQ